jgi:hypothetical protein
MITLLMISQDQSVLSVGEEIEPKSLNSIPAVQRTLDELKKRIVQYGNNGNGEVLVGKVVKVKTQVCISSLFEVI